MITTREHRQGYLLVPFLIIMVLSVPSTAQQSYPTKTFAPLGRLVDIGGRKLHVLLSGKGSPTVILVAGGSAYSIDWALVQQRVDSTTRVCSYDRAGLGWSEPGPEDETVEQTVSDLHTLLQAAGEQPPYILVGASIGGIFIQAYQRAYPDEVSGLVFTNSANRVGFSGKNKAGLLWELTEDEVRSAFPLPATATKGPKPVTEGQPFDKLPSDLQSIRLWFDVQQWERWDPAKANSKSVISWRQEFLREFSETDSGKTPLGNLPVIVVSSSPSASQSERYSRGTAGARLDFLSSNSLHITATGSGHEIHLFQPDVVVQAIRRAIVAIRSNVPLSAVPDIPTEKR